MHQGISCVVLQHLVALIVCAVFVRAVCFDVADVVLDGSGLPPQESPVMIAEKRKLFFSFLSVLKGSKD